MQPLKPVGPAARILLGLSFFLIFLLVWGGLTYGGVVPGLFLASPGRPLGAGWALLTQYGFATDIGVTIWRVVGGFAVAALCAVPLGLAMGAYKPIEAFF